MDNSSLVHTKWNYMSVGVFSITFPAGVPPFVSSNLSKNNKTLIQLLF